MDSRDPRTLLQRRTWISGSTVALLGATASTGCDRGAGPTGQESAPAEVPEAARPLLGDLRPGAAVGQWTLVAVHPIRHGALPVVLADANGVRYQVDVLARDAAGPDGVANTDRLSFFVANRGDGGTPTDEGQGLGAMALAAALSERERSGATLPELATFSERASAYPDGSFAVPLG